MCFSAGASFAAAAILIPAGVYTTHQARKLGRGYSAIALLPLVFGLQQWLEGMVWLGIGPDGVGTDRYAALGFIFFSHFFWLLWIPLACWLVEPQRFKKKVFLALAVAGAVYGLVGYLFLWSHPDRLVVEVVSHSIDYQTVLVYDGTLPRLVARGLYALVVLTPLLWVSDRGLNLFGVLIAVSVAVASLVYGHAFVSVWCYFAAVLSLYIYVMVDRKAARQVVAA